MVGRRPTGELVSKSVVRNSLDPMYIERDHMMMKSNSAVLLEQYDKEIQPPAKNSENAIEEEQEIKLEGLQHGNARGGKKPLAIEIELKKESSDPINLKLSHSDQLRAKLPSPLIDDEPIDDIVNPSLS